MKVMEAIGKSFNIATKNFGILVILFIFNMIWNFATMLSFGNINVPSNLKLTPQVVILGIIFILFNIFIQGGLLGALKDAIVSEGKVVLGNFAKYGAKFYLRFLSLAIFIVAALALAALIIALIFSITLAVKNIIVNIIVISVVIILALIALWYLFLLFFSPYALVADDVGVFKSIKNSMRFVKSHVWEITGLSAILILVALGLGFLAGILAGFFSLAIKGTAFQIVTGIISSAVNAYVTVLLSAGFMMYYVAISGVGQKKETEQTLA